MSEDARTLIVKENDEPLDIECARVGKLATAIRSSASSSILGSSG
jgi:hypothetical protein